MRKIGLLIPLALAAGFLFVVPLVSANPYGSGDYGACEYGSCSISLSSSATVNLPVTPSASNSCTVASGTISVSTGSSTGYRLMLSSSTNDRALVDGAKRIEASSGTVTSPAILTANVWGFRVDGGNFGTGPTSAVSSGSIPALTFAGPPSNEAPATIFSPTTVRPAPDVTTVWYGVCANTSQPSGDYSRVVTYTAVLN